MSNTISEAITFLNSIEEDFAYRVLNEAIENINLDTETEHIEVSAEPKQDQTEDLMIAPIDDFDIDNVESEINDEGEDVFDANVEIETVSDEEPAEIEDEISDEEESDEFGESLDVSRVEESLDDTQKAETDVDNRLEYVYNGIAKKKLRRQSNVMDSRNHKMMNIAPTTRKGLRTESFRTGRHFKTLSESELVKRNHTDLYESYIDPMDIIDEHEYPESLVSAFVKYISDADVKDFNYNAFMEYVHDECFTWSQDMWNLYRHYADSPDDYTWTQVIEMINEDADNMYSMLENYVMNIYEDDEEIED